MMGMCVREIDIEEMLGLLNLRAVVSVSRRDDEDL